MNDVLKAVAEYVKPIAISLLVYVGTLLKPTVPFAGVLFFAILFDCVSAFHLSRRARKKYPERATGKFKSEHALKMLNTFLKMYGVILFIYLIEKFIIPMHHWNLTNYAALACCLLQLYSILENISSENGMRWAKVLQKFMVNKAERHFDIKLDDLKDGEET